MFAPLAPPLRAIHERLKRAFDPNGILNPGRLYPGLVSRLFHDPGRTRMQTSIAAEFAGTADGIEAEAILRKCVHCGFCTATCPTYQLLGDELDGPRGRIYLIKQVLEGHAPTRATQLHLDRCLTCRNCETTCPSGVQYGNLVEIGRRIVDERVPRPAGERALRGTLREGLTSPLFAPAMKVGQALRGALPAALKAKVPPRAPARAHRWPTRKHRAQGAAARSAASSRRCCRTSTARPRASSTPPASRRWSPTTPAAAARSACTSATTTARSSTCAQHRRLVAAGRRAARVEAIVMNASGCGVTVKEYGHSLARDPHYAHKAEPHRRPDARPLASCCRIARPGSRWQAEGCEPRRRAVALAFHPPCTLQHGQRLRGGSRRRSTALGFDVRVAANEAHLCCGSAGTYSVLQPELANALRDRKLGHLERARAGDHRLGQHRLHPAPAERNGDAGAALDRGARRRARAMTPRYQEFAPDPALAAHVHCTWSFAGDEDGIEQAVPPDGRCELIVHCGRPYEERGRAGAWRAQPRIALRRPADSPAGAALARRGRGDRHSLHAGRRLGLRRRAARDAAPIAASTLAALHGAAAAARCAPSLAPPPTTASAARRRSAPTSPADRRCARPPRRAVERCVERMLASEGRVTLAALSALAGLGERQLQRRFAEVVGISPRTLGVVVRLRRVFDALRDAPWSSWSERAQAAGFFDHPQMARDFRRLLGTRAVAVVARGRGLAASLADATPDAVAKLQAGARGAA